MLPVMSNCTICPLHENRRCIVHPFGHLDHPSILFVGTGPREVDEYEGQPFMGVDGHILSGLVKLADIPLKEIAMTNRPVSSTVAGSNPCPASQ